MTQKIPIEMQKLGEIYDERDNENIRKTLSLASFPMLVQKTKFGPAYPKCVENIFVILTHHPDFAGNFRFDLWTNKMEIRKKGNEWGYIKEYDYIYIQRIIQRLYNQFSTIGKELVIDAVESACRENTYDSAENYLRSLEWDMKPRLKSFISNSFNVEKSKYHSAVGENFFKGMAKRIIDPGCKFDTMVILVGDQGIEKSKAFETIASKPWYVETALNVENKDFFMQFQGKLIVEFSEGETMSRSDAKHLKAVVSTPVDTYRASYGRITEDHPRRCVFTMTTNQIEVLKDETGARRYYPINVDQQVNIQYIKDNRDQLFAEALYRVECLNEKFWEYPEEESKNAQAQFMVRSQFEDTIDKWLENPIGMNGHKIDIESNGLIISDIWVYCLNGDKSRFSKRDEMAIGLALVGLGYEKSKRMIDGIRKVRWYKKGSTTPLV